MQYAQQLRYHARQRRTRPGPAGRPARANPTTDAEIRAWARGEGLAISSGGRIPVEIRAAYRHAHT
ncbi:Lsr2 family DNA-binding protein [Phytohabitans sp. LJ34]|uniref:Lsr2 family DNA-binding protein n=1 Tax=Phytohabitans sp. LJ34 TaxID=3452217 RepID=UPI003F8999A4